MSILKPLELSEKAVEQKYLELEERLKELGKIYWLEDWKKEVEKYPLPTVEQMKFIVDQITMIIEHLYVHLNMKRVRRAVDIEQALKILKQQLDDDFDKLQFHHEIQVILKKLGDIHTAYRLPQPYLNSIAFLPFLIRKCYSGRSKSEKASYVVTETLWDTSKNPELPINVGDTIISWNGIPIEKAIEIHGRTVEGSNPEADRAFALQSMTIRWLGASFEPNAPWVIIGVKRNGVEDEVKLSWRVIMLNNAGDLVTRAQYLWHIFDQAGPRAEESDSAITPDIALNHSSQISQFIAREIFKPEKIENKEQEAILDSNLDSLRNMNISRHSKGTENKRLAFRNFTHSMQTVPRLARIPHSSKQLIRSPVPVNLKFSPVEAWRIQYNKSEFGHIRIWAFPPEPFISDEDFIMEIRRLLAILPHQGLILDIRDNPGGSIRKAESILQLLSAQDIETFKFQLFASLLTKKIAENSNNPFDEYKDSLDMALCTGYRFSKGMPITDEDYANKWGQEYFGPVVMLTSATSYSAADFISASFEDHNIGEIIGVDGTTGGGGANVWLYKQDLCKFLPEETTPPNPGSHWPDGIGLQFAARVALRMHENSGVPIEELGVTPTRVIRLTRNDLMKDNIDLVKKCLDILAKKEHYEFTCSFKRKKKSLYATINSKNLNQLIVVKDDRFISSHDITSRRATTTEINLGAIKSGSDLEIYGYSSIEKDPENLHQGKKVVHYKHTLAI